MTQGKEGNIGDNGGDWLEKEAAGDEELLELLRHKESELNKYAAGEMPRDGSIIEIVDGLNAAIQKRQAEIGYDPSKIQSAAYPPEDLG
ncbi:hypothetical protein CSA80_04410 [Candidatus Saccharibacteria bacterium]|nr:MAG: hypothetical protein CR973_01515 [Candidatus Saccharibacteria bacterium]PID98912.1 MAG: hypothetical protein CSA80_04410 [Candidatus Saccharibacteria bacterium]